MRRRRKPQRGVMIMKPVELTLQGLNSFRDVQHVDFESLCADGIFGIFGPTGSGKSTILDAITLALYGTVERAANHTQGILNQLEDQLSVGFTFELAGQKKTRYRAERTYKRKKDGGMRTSSCRLMKLGEKTEVLADKERDLTWKIQEILGLTHDDFTRAVVLPQGKFSEFLSLKGNDRRQMLQRLFHLEKYGDELTARLKRHADAAKQRLTLISEKEAVLGDASKEAVETLRERLRQVTDELARKRTALEKSLLERDRVKQVWDFQEEKRAKTAALQALLEKQPAIEKERRLLELDDAAEKILPYLEALIASEKEYQNANDVFTQTEKRFAASGTAEESKRRVHEEAKKVEEERGPLLSEHKQQLVQGLGLQQQLSRVRREMAADAASLAKLDHEIRSCRQSGDKEKQRKEELLKKLEQLEKSLQKLEISSGRRAAIRKALDEKAAIDLIDSHLKEKRKEWTENQKAWLECSDERDRLSRNRQLLDEKSGQLFKRYQAVYNQAAVISERIRMARAYLKARREEAEKEQETVFRKRLSLNLATELKDGEACPVCGAVHHPHPAEAGKYPSEEAISQTIRFYQKADDSLILQQQEIKICLNQLEQQSGTFTALFSEALRAEFPDGVSEAAEFVNWEKAGFKPVLEETELAVREEKQDVLSLGGAFDRLSDEARQMEADRLSLESQLNFYDEKKKRIQSAALVRKKEMEDRMKNWPDEFPPIDAIQNTYRKVQEADQKAEKIRTEIAQARQELNLIEQRLAGKEEKSRGLEANWNEIKGRMDASEQSCTRDVAALKALNLAENDPIEDNLSKLNQVIEQMKRNRENSYREWQQALTVHIEADKRFNNASDRKERAEKSKGEAEERWAGRISRSSFEKREEVLAAHLPEETRAAFDGEIAAFEKEKARLVSDLQSLSEKLMGRSVDREKLDEVEERCNCLKREVQTLSERYGADAKELEGLEEKHVLFKQLESDRKRTQQASDQFEKLQRVFRGNAFVEFVAEEQMQQVCLAASKRLGDLTRGRYALEVDGSGGFRIRDDGNGGVRRPVSSLSGGETFLTSLALALSLSEQIQLRGNVPLQFFFLDEGFGTLDPDLLDTVVTALEKLHMRRLSIGVISHVPEMRERLPRRLIVEPALPSGKGSRVRMEVL